MLASIFGAREVAGVGIAYEQALLDRYEPLRQRAERRCGATGSATASVSQKPSTCLRPRVAVNQKRVDRGTSSSAISVAT